VQHFILRVTTASHLQVASRFKLTQIGAKGEGKRNMRGSEMATILHLLAGSTPYHQNPADSHDTGVMARQEF